MNLPLHEPPSDERPPSPGFHFIILETLAHLNSGSTDISNIPSLRGLGPAKVQIGLIMAERKGLIQGDISNLELTGKGRFFAESWKDEIEKTSHSARTMFKEAEGG